MNIAEIVGPVDVYGAVVSIGIGASFTILGVTAMSRTSNRKRNHDFELAKLQAKYAHDATVHNVEEQTKRELAGLAMKREIEFKRIDSGMIDVKVNGKPDQYGQHSG
jgi:hypothetical protein